MNKLLNRAMALLARRDHSEHELRCKLAAQPAFSRHKPHRNRSPHSGLNEQASHQSKQELSALIDSVVQHCYQYHWLDDKKFAVSFTKSRYSKGYGPQRIKQELKHKGVDNALIDSTLAECEFDWVELAVKQIDKQFGRGAVSDWHRRSKIYSHLAYRGFYSEDIGEALKRVTA